MADIAKIQVGIDGVSPPSGADFDFLFTESATQKFPIGQRVCMSNGAVFHYAYAAEALTRRYLCSAATTAASNKQPYILGYGTSSVSGVKTVPVICSATSITANQFQGGQLCVCDATGEGQNLFIKSHTAGTSGQTITVETINPTVTSITSQSECGFVPNPFYGVQKYDATAESWPIGVTNIAVTSGYYFWIQTWGPTVALADAGPPVQGGPCAPSSATQGAVGEFCITTIAAGVYPQIGFAGPMAGVSTESLPIFLTICP